jgi:hypothetical protein
LALHLASGNGRALRVEVRTLNFSYLR